MTDYTKTAVRTATIAIVIGVLAAISGVRMGQEQFVLFIVVMAWLGLVSQFAKNIGVGFSLITLSIFAMIAEYIAPGSVTGPVTGSVSVTLRSAGIDPGPIFQINSISFFIMAVIGTAVAIAVSLRITGEKKFAGPLVDRTLREMAQIFEIYASTARLLLTFGFLLAIILLEQGALVAGELGSLAADAPFIAVNLLTGLVGYLSLGGTIPIINTIPILGDLSALEFIWVVGFWLMVAAAIKYEASGPTAQFLRR